MNRVKILLPEQGIQRIKNSKILVLGAGGVGSHICEALVRNGFKKITIVDNDILEQTNLNRHSYAFSSNIGKYKAIAIKRYLESIYDDIEINSLNIELTKNNVVDIISEDFDFVADAIDKLITKTHVIKTCYERNIKIISSMGAGGKTDFNKIKIDDISNASGDSLLRRVKKMLKKFNIIKGIPVVYSTEPVKYIELSNNTRILGSCAHIPAIFGNIIAGYIFNSIAFIDF